MVQISKRAQDNSFAQKERERRRRKVLMDQMKALKSQEVSTSHCNVPHYADEDLQVKTFNLFLNTIVAESQ